MPWICSFPRRPARVAPMPFVLPGRSAPDPAPARAQPGDPSMVAGLRAAAFERSSARSSLVQSLKPGLGAGTLVAGAVAGGFAGKSLVVAGASALAAPAGPWAGPALATAVGGLVLWRMREGAGVASEALAALAGGGEAGRTAAALALAAALAANVLPGALALADDDPHRQTLGQALLANNLGQFVCFALAEAGAGALLRRFGAPLAVEHVDAQGALVEVGEPGYAAHRLGRKARHALLVLAGMAANAAVAQALGNRAVLPAAAAWLGAPAQAPAFGRSPFADVFLSNLAVGLSVAAVEVVRSTANEAALAVADAATGVRTVPGEPVRAGDDALAHVERAVLAARTAGAMRQIGYTTVLNLLVTALVLDCDEEATLFGLGRGALLALAANAMLSAIDALGAVAAHRRLARQARVEAGDEVECGDPEFPPASSRFPVTRHNAWA